MKRSIVIMLLAFAAITKGQDAHFSQFFNQPLLLNPAQTGVMPEDFRAALIHRNQWQGINSTFESSAFSLDMNFKEGFLNKDRIGVGVVFLNDELGEGAFRNFGALLSMSYYRVLDYHKRHHLSIGVQGGYFNKSMDYSSSYFESQYDGFILDKGMPSGESLENTQLNQFSVQAGAYWYFRASDRLTIDAGASFFQINTPEETFATTVDSLSYNPLSMRTVGHVGAEWLFANHFILYPKVLFMNQANARNIYGGALIGYELNMKHQPEIQVGAFHRYEDATTLMVGGKYKNAKVMFSYDITQSGLTQTQGIEGAGPSRSLGAWEISLMWKGMLSRPLPEKYTVPCGIF